MLRKIHDAIMSWQCTAICALVAVVCWMVTPSMQLALLTLAIMAMGRLDMLSERVDTLQELLTEDDEDEEPGS